MEPLSHKKNLNIFIWQRNSVNNFACFCAGEKIYPYDEVMYGK